MNYSEIYTIICISVCLTCIIAFDIIYIETNKYVCICDPTTYTYIDSIFERPFYKCVSSCPYGYYFFRGKEYICAEKCDITAYNLIIASNNSCVENCPSDHPYYYELDGKKYCSKKCPSKLPFYYSSQKQNNGIICKSACNTGHFYFSDTK